MSLLDSAASRPTERPPLHPTPAHSIAQLRLWLRGITARREVTSATRPDRSRTLEVHCGNCQARFTAWYAANDIDAKLMHVKRCGLCGGDPPMKGLYKDCSLRLVALVTPHS